MALVPHNQRQTYDFTGEVVALVGPSGGGKSSIIKLLQRFYEPQGGTVLIDGRAVGDYDPKWLVSAGFCVWIVCDSGC